MNQNSYEKVNAGKLMEEYIESGSYQHLKKLTLEKEVLHEILYQHLIDHEAKRHEIGYHLVAKFIPKNVYHYDYVGLNEYLYDRGLLQKVVSLTSSTFKKDPELLRLFEPYRLEPEFYLKPSFNIRGKEKFEILRPAKLNLSLDEAAKRKRDNWNSLKEAQSNYETLKKQMLVCHDLQNTKKVHHSYGSLSLLPKPSQYHIQQITDKQAIKVLIELGKPRMDQLPYFIVNGFIKKSEVESFRELIDIRLDFVILDATDEANMMKNF